MGTRLYFPFASVSDLIPTMQPGWDRIDQATTLALARSKMAGDFITPGTTIEWSPGEKALDRRYVSEELDTQLISGRVVIQVMKQEVGSTFDATAVVGIYVCKSDGSIRGELLVAKEWSSSHNYPIDSYNWDNHKDVDKTLNSVFVKRGDRLVVCLGHTDRNGLGASARALWGNPEGVDDLPYDAAEVSYLVPWIEFNRPIYFAPITVQPGVFESTTDKAFSFPTSRPHFPGTAVPHLGIDEQLFLVRPIGTPATGFRYQIVRQIDGTYQRIEWWHHRTGGCGSFRLHIRDSFPEQNPAIEDGWEIWCKVRLPNESQYKIWYRGIIRSCHAARGGNEVLTEVRGYGYIEQLNFIQVQKTYPKGMSVSDVVNDILNFYIKPHTRIVRPNDLYPTDDNGVDVSNWQLKGDVHFECSALKAIKFLAELQGNREWGVDERRCFYFRSNQVVGTSKSFYLDKDTLNMIGGGKAFDRLNQVKLQGKQFTGREYLRIHADVTDVTNHGLFERAHEVPWVTNDVDADHWADNIIDQHTARESWVNFTWQGIDTRLDAYHPMPKCNYYGHDTSNERQLLNVGKVQYVKGGFNRKGEVREIGQQIQQTDTHSPVLTATIYLGAWRKDLIEELERNVYDPLAALQGKLRQFRNPNSDVLFPSDGKVIGEPFALICPTEQRATRWQWDGTEWVAQQQVRRGTVLPSFGIFGGQEFFLITDIPNQIGTLYWWTGEEWSLFGSGTGGSGDYDLIRDPNFWMFGG
jgi:hypothetical protein